MRLRKIPEATRNAEREVPKRRDAGFWLGCWGSFSLGAEGFGGLSGDFVGTITRSKGGASLSKIGRALDSLNGLLGWKVNSQRAHSSQKRGQTCAEGRFATLTQTLPRMWRFARGSVICREVLEGGDVRN